MAGHAIAQQSSNGSGSIWLIERPNSGGDLNSPPEFNPSGPLSKQSSNYNNHLDD
jgi:hypothetical protein